MTSVGESDWRLRNVSQDKWWLHEYKVASWASGAQSVAPNTFEDTVRQRRVVVSAYEDYQMGTACSKTRAC